MSDNSIEERQNQEFNIMRLAAQRQLYSDVKKLSYIKFYICTVLVILGNIFSLHKAENDLIYYTFLLIKIISAIVPFIALDKWINERKELAAIIQEEFDNDVLSTNWNDEKYGARGIHNQEIHKYAMKYQKKFRSKSQSEDKNIDWETGLKKWYEAQYSKMPLSLGRIFCQATNINWDKGLRLKFQEIIFTILVGMVIILFSTSFIINNKFVASIEYHFLPFVPFIIYLIQIIIANHKTIDELNNLRNHLDKIIIAKNNPDITEDKLFELSNDLQCKIFKYRKNAFALPDKLFSITKDEQEALSNNYATMETQYYEMNK